MSQRQSKLLWMRDLIEHMSSCHEQLQWMGDARGARYLTESLMHNLNECRRLCEELLPAGQELSMRGSA